MVKKRTGLVTKAYLDGAIQHVLDVLGGWIQESSQETGAKIDGLENKFDARFSELGHQINNLKVDTPTQKEFNELSGRTTRLEHFQATN